ncbi:aminoglycoside 6-adenylyltransferase [Sporomusa termitida]|uniref:Aminoglycoside 6-adenylyltransferase n=1 Tax=Sporomusa termitida TaxID=2377 RepID=A0A517DUG2_9FIRM|nr:aminoglycoside 6-adenylyltransferase [Sporomusa termitida]QDR80994.1 Aminoglycoside 6-adenylyltransferase [Sporomusa termitida]
MNTNQQLLEAIVSFANINENISALILIGSQARLEKYADQYSDIDLIMVVNNPEYFLSSNEWLEDIGSPHISFIEPTIGGEKEKRVMFDNALDVDFVIISQEHAQNAIQRNEIIGILHNGYKILVNKQNLTIPPLINPPGQSYAVPSEDTFTNLVNDFWYHAVWTTKKFLRQELWSAKFCVDSYMKWKLLWMIEQYEHVKHGQSYNTWYSGRFIDSWVDADIKDRLCKTFAHYENADMISSLFETMDLFRNLAIQVAEGYGFEYPSHADEYATNWVRKKLTNHL